MKFKITFKTPCATEEVENTIECLKERSVIFKTTPEQIINLDIIVSKMMLEKISPSFISEASHLAKTDQGVYDLMKLWMDHPDEREKIIKDIDKSINDYQAPSQLEGGIRKCISKYITYGEYITIEFDTDNQSATVIPRKK